MKSTSTPKPSSAWELAAGIVALATVALIALVGLRVPRQQVSSPAESSSLSNAVLQSSQSFTPASGEQLSEQGATSPPVSTAVVTSSGSADATSPNVQTASAYPIPAPANPTGNASAQIAVQQQPSADQVRTGHAPAEQPRSTNRSAPPAAHWSSLFAAPADAAAAEPIVGSIPLPRKRPHSVAFAEAAIPLPQPRPDAPRPGEPQAPTGSSNWLDAIFQASPSSTAEPEPVHQGDY
jgi:hypothetical protein